METGFREHGYWEGGKGKRRKDERERKKKLEQEKEKESGSGEENEEANKREKVMGWRPSIDRAPDYKSLRPTGSHRMSTPNEEGRKGKGMNFERMFIFELNLSQRRYRAKTIPKTVTPPK